MSAVNLLILVNCYEENRVKMTEKGECRRVWILLLQFLLALKLCYCKAALLMHCPTECSLNTALHRVSYLILKVTV